MRESALGVTLVAKKKSKLASLLMGEYEFNIFLFVLYANKKGSLVMRLPFF